MCSLVDVFNNFMIDDIGSSGPERAATELASSVVRGWIASGDGYGCHGR